MIRVFPVAETAHPQFADAFGSHRGTDIFAPKGAPVLAVDDGEARSDIDPKGGQVIYLHAVDGTIYYYAHLDSYVGRFPRHVGMSEEIGTVGTTGDAVGKDPHLHFEVHPNGARQSVDPYPLLLDVAPAGSMRMPVPKMPLPPNPLAAPGTGGPESAHTDASEHSGSSLDGLLVLALAFGAAWLKDALTPPKGPKL